jgi:hypothetical protein
MPRSELPINRLSVFISSRKCNRLVEWAECVRSCTWLSKTFANEEPTKRHGNESVPDENYAEVSLTETEGGSRGLKPLISATTR